MGEGKREKPRSLSMGKLIWVGIGLGALFWILEAAVHVLVFHEGNLIEQILSPDPYNIWHRLFVACILIIFGVYAHFAITERRQVEEALRKSEEKYRGIFEKVTTSIVLLDKDGQIVDINPYHITHIGKGRTTKEDYLGKNIVTHPSIVKAGLSETYARLLKGEAFELKDVYFPTTTGGTNGYFNVKGVPLFEEGKVIGAITIHEDITERKRAEEALKEYSERLEDIVKERTKELREAQEQLIRKERLAILGELAGGVGHELRNPLGVISNAVYYLQTTQSDADETTKEYLELIATEVRNSEKIVSDLLDLFRTRLPEKEKIAVSDLVTHVLDRHTPPKGVKVTTKIASDLPPVCVDPRQIGQVLVNLVTNAYQAMPEGGKLTIKANHEKDQVWLSITDTGGGIPQENMERLFEPLFTTKARGIGLGLAVSKNLVEVNGGSIEVESEEGKGSTFTVTLPTKEEQA